MIFNYLMKKVQQKWNTYLVLFTLIAAELVDQPSPEVALAQGRLRGKISADGGHYEYIGIPYGSFNKTTRFQAPLPPPSWEGVFEATDEIYFCPQPFGFLVFGREDCLRLNVYAPVRNNRKLPVMVFIHGGAFYFGGGGKLLYGPDFIVKHNVILVTINYRLGALGFLCLGIKEAPGNAGLKDQLAALRWIRKNIAEFGGDPDNITIFGESAGGASVSLFLSTDVNETLYHKMIIQSGTSLAFWSVNQEPLRSASLLAKRLGYDAQDPYELHDILSKASNSELVSLKFGATFDQLFEEQILHLPCIEKPFKDVESFLTNSPYNLLINKNNFEVPIMYGFTSNEGLFILSMETKTSLARKNETNLFTTGLNSKSELNVNGVMNKIKQHYFGEGPIKIESPLDMSKLFGNLYFNAPIIMESEILANRSSSPVYNYYFDYSGMRNAAKFVTFPFAPGACHSDELFYQFKSRIWPFPIGRKDQKVVCKMTQLWTNFAKYGNPTPKSTLDSSITWLPSNASSLNFFHIGSSLKMSSTPSTDEYQLWKEAYKIYHSQFET